MHSSSSSVATSGPTYISSDLVPSWFRRERCRLLTTPQTSHKVQNTLRDDGGATATAGCVIYWMQRDMRTVDNWAMLLTQHLASEHFQVPMRVLYTMPPPYTVSPRPSSSSSSPPCYTNMTARHASFLLGGLQSVEEELRELHVPFDILFPTYETPLTSGMEIPTKMFVKSSITADVKTYVQSHQACAIVTDFSPLRHIRDWTEEFASAMTLDNITIPIYQVDAHNIVPVWLASNKKEVGARTLRPRIHKLLPDFLTTYPSIIGNKKDRRETAGQQQAANSTTFESRPIIDWKKCEDFLQPDVSVPPVSTWAKPGTKSGMAQFEFFCRKGLSKYSDLRNDPTQDNICSSMSPWTNYGHVSFQTLALSIKALKVHTNAAASFLEEGIVRRELSDNFCFYCKDGYDSIDGGAADWAKDSLALHERDPREYIYTLEEFMNGETHDDLWNAAQMQVVQTGKMHGFVSMTSSLYYIQDCYLF
jgi:deoxyribodipyrimidine photo-lyase